MKTKGNFRNVCFVIAFFFLTIIILQYCGADSELPPLDQSKFFQPTNYDFENENIPPFGRITYPRADQYLNTNNFVVTGSVYDTNLIKTIDLKIDGKTVNFEYQENWNAYVYLENGVHSISLQVIDYYGSSSTPHSFNFYVDSEVPVIDIQSHKENDFCRVGTNTISGIVNDNLQQIFMIKFKIDSDDWKIISLKDDNKWENTVEISEFGKHIISVKAIDRCGNVNTDTAYLTLKKPEIVYINPVSDSINVNVNEDIKITFDQKMDSSVTGTVSLGLASPVQYIDGSNCSINIIDHNVYISPDEPFLPGERISYLIVNGFKSIYETQINDYCNHEYNFRTNVGMVNITNHSSNSTDSDSVWTGTNYAVTWIDDRSGNDEIYFATFNTQGLDNINLVKVTNNPNNKTSPKIVWNGQYYGLCWVEDINSCKYIKFVCLNTDGSNVNSIVNIASANFVGPLSLSRNLNNMKYVLCWGEYYVEPKIRYCKIYNTNNVYGPHYVITNPTPSSPYDNLTIAIENNTYMFVWMENGNEIKVRKHASDYYSTSYSIVNSTGQISNFSLVWNNNYFGLAWIDDSTGRDEIYFTHFDLNGNKMMNDVQITNNPEEKRNPSLSWTFTAYGLVWEQHSTNSSEIFYMEFNSQGIPKKQPVLITDDPGNYRFPTLLYADNKLGTFFEEIGSSNPDIFFSELTLSGTKY